MSASRIYFVSHLSAKNYRNWWKFDEVLTKTNLLSFFWDTVYSGIYVCDNRLQELIIKQTCATTWFGAIMFYQSMLLSACCPLNTYPDDFFISTCYAVRFLSVCVSPSW